MSRRVLLPALPGNAADTSHARMRLPSPLGVLPSFVENFARKKIKDENWIKRLEQPLPDFIKYSYEDAFEAGADHVRDWWCMYDDYKTELEKAEAEDRERFNLLLSPLTWNEFQKEWRKRHNLNRQRKAEFEKTKPERCGEMPQ